MNTKPENISECDIIDDSYTYIENPHSFFLSLDVICGDLFRQSVKNTNFYIILSRNPGFLYTPFGKKKNETNEGCFKVKITKFYADLINCKSNNIYNVYLEDENNNK